MRPEYISARCDLKLLVSGWFVHQWEAVGCHVKLAGGLQL